MKAFTVSRSDLPLQPAPIPADWIHEGRPQARNLVISKSRDGAAFTILWECTAGVFTWRYDYDETLHIQDGEAVLTDASGERRIGAGDVIFFPAGARVTWRIDRYIRKVAFFRHVLPAPVAAPMRAWWKLMDAGRALAATIRRRARRSVRGGRIAAPLTDFDRAHPEA